METEILEDILTFDELLEDDYYRSEFEKRVQERLNINSHSDVKGGNNTMDNTIQQPEEGEIENKGLAPEALQADDPAAKETADGKSKEEKTEEACEPAKEMTAEQFEQYNEALRRVSKTAKGGLTTRYNAFEDAEVKALVRQQVMAGEKPDVKNIAAEVIARLSPKEEPAPEPKRPSEADEVKSLKAELALVKAGIVPERLEAAKKLFLAEGGDPNKAAEFAMKYPEWKAGSNNGGVVFTKASPVAGKTAANTAGPPVLNDFERKVAAARKRAGLE